MHTSLACSHKGKVRDEDASAVGQRLVSVRVGKEQYASQRYHLAFDEGGVWQQVQRLVMPCKASDSAWRQMAQKPESRGMWITCSDKAESMLSFCRPN